MKILALDVGDRRIGMAISDELGISGQPLPPLTNDKNQWKELINIIGLHQIQYIVIGMPYRLDGQQGPQAEKVRAWADELRQHIHLPIEMVDERMTTRTAERVLIEGNVRRQKRKQLVDSLAALLILQTYLDRKRKDDRDDGVSRG